MKSLIVLTIISLIGAIASYYLQFSSLYQSMIEFRGLYVAQTTQVTLTTVISAVFILSFITLIYAFIEYKLTYKDLK